MRAVAGFLYKIGARDAVRRFLAMPAAGEGEGVDVWEAGGYRFDDGAGAGGRLGDKAR